MISYLIRRIPILFLTLVGIAVIVFGMIHIVPGDAADLLRQSGGMKVSKESIESMRKLWHLDQPVWRQFLLWSSDLLRGNFGNSIQDGRPVLTRISEALPSTLLLNAASLFVAIVVAIPVGILAAARRGSRFDRFSGVGFFMLMSLPDFWIALLLGSLISVKLGWLPLFGMTSDNYAQLSAAGKIVDRISHLILPTTCLTMTSLAFLSRLARSSLLEVIRQDYVRTARAKGLSERTVLFKHAFRNALVPLVTLFGFLLPAMIGGSVIIERIFSWPGIGRLYFDAILTRDYPIIMGLTLFTGALTLAANLISDILYAAVDPRVRLQ